MTKDNVRKALEESAVKHYSLDETTEIIIRRAYRTFGILVLIGQPVSILKFVERDGHRQLCIDDRLPFGLGVLQEIFSDDIVTRQFHEKQKEFTIPIFDKSALPRNFKGEITLPFLEDHHIGSGGFGNVYKIKIPSSYHRYSVSSEWFVRKEFRPESTQNDFERELQNLSMLRLLRHPNIVELLGVYTHDGMHNFLFPLASEGTLAELFRSERSPHFQSSEEYFIALAGLGSAVCAMHDYSSESLRAIGCHHDLKPSNVLVDKSDFILADFGLSRLKELPQTSATLSKDARGDYLAPECEDLEADCEKQLIHRSSDIWSFGCIIAELLTYMIQGPTGVKAFEEKRVYNVRGLVLWRFHCGPEKPSRAVTDWMAMIKSKSQGPQHRLALLVEDMLAIRPEQRPRARVVKERLCALALEATSQPIDHLYDAVSCRSRSIQVFAEQNKFACWKWAYGIAAAEHAPVLDISDRGYEWKSYESFQSALYHLRQLHSTLKLIDSDYQISKSLLPLQLQRIGDHLFGILPQSLQDQATVLWEHSLLETADNRLLEQVSNGLIVGDSGTRVSALAAIKQMRHLVQKRSNHGATLFLDPKCLQDWEHVECFSSKIDLPDESRTISVLVERKKVDVNDIDDRVAGELLDCLEGVANIVNCAEDRKVLRVLHCRGVYFDDKANAFGMVYDFPELSTPMTELRATTLTAALDRKSGSQEMPFLGERFRLAHALAASLFRFHSIGWLHKSIASKAIMFFSHPGLPRSEQMQNWYLRGFLHSRLNEENFPTSGLTIDSELMDYQHPDYLTGLRLGKWRYQPRFDYYSLGIVLLEIGLWTSLEAMLGRWKGSPEEMRGKLLDSIVPKLGPRAGALYRDAVTTCLTGRFAEAEGGDFAAIRLSFKALVVDRIAQCKA
ncbi:MAG: hypothetical protein Q9195_005758 [Heterodermia aff. obscurata]